MAEAPHRRDPSPIDAACSLCRADGGRLIVRTPFLRVVLVDDADYPGFARVIWNAHRAELSDLSSEERQRLLDAVLIVEQAQRAQLLPYKINLASLGNSVPHLHWHVIPRYFDDAHFPHPIWGMRQRESDPVVVAARRQRVAGLERAIVAAFGGA